MSNNIWPDFLAKYPRHTADMRDGGYYSNTALSCSSLKEYLLNTPAHFLHYHLNSKEATDSMVLGKAVDHLLTDRHTPFESKFAIAPDRRSTEGKARYAELEKTHWLLNAENYQKAQDIAKAAPRPWETAIHAIECQMELQWEYAGIPLKGCIDVRTDRAFYDIKTTQDCHPRKCWYTAKQYGYWYQLAMYYWGCREMGYPIEKAYLLFLQTKAPYLSHLVEVPVVALEPLIDELKAAIHSLIGSIHTDNWPGYNTALWQSPDTFPGTQLDTFFSEEPEF